MSIIFLLAGLFLSCTSSPSAGPYKPLSDIPDAQVMGTIQAKFDTMHSEYLLAKVNEAAYISLMEAAAQEYQGAIDVRDITWLHIGWNTAKSVNEFSAIGKVVSLSGGGAKGIEGALAKAAGQILKNVPPNSKIAILYISAPDKSTADYVAGEFEFICVDAGYTITDRSQLDAIREEQNFQMSGEVDDETAVSIGKIIGATIIVTGGLDGEGSLRRLRLRALDTQTAHVIAVASEPL